VSKGSKYSGIWSGVLSKSKDGYEFKMINRRDQSATFFVKYGKFNFFSEFVAGDYWYRLVKIEVPT